MNGVEIIKRDSSDGLNFKRKNIQQRLIFLTLQMAVKSVFLLNDNGKATSS